MDFVCAELERAGRGKKDEITIIFEFDSDENGQAKFNGNHYKRFR
jgi:hypothetical protein